jgi:hypothetical protein
LEPSTTEKKEDFKKARQKTTNFPIVRTASKEETPHHHPQAKPISSAHSFIHYLSKKPLALYLSKSLLRRAIMRQHLAFLLQLFLKARSSAIPEASSLATGYT